jgi:sRNA-binding carbon storage regulator CsrA
MLILSRAKDQRVFSGAPQPNNPVPLSNTVVDINGNNVKLGYESHTSPRVTKFFTLPLV